ncbi:MAG: undecaprenyl-diphosphate phosphatase [Flavobacteriaceae bacterium]|nr:undecaprenyl-diphosphate phosphatase [Flavobacteriaceae bacterium]
MSYLESLILGIIQGLTEFLPVSSSGHLELAKLFFDEKGQLHDANVTMTVVLHFATALSTIFVFRNEVVELIKGLFSFKGNEETKFSLKIIVSMVPAVVIGLFFEKQLESLFNSNVMLVGFMLMLTAVLLLLADMSKNTGKNIGYKNAIIIGVSQAVSMLPGVSRSGATISTSVLLGVDREKAARFSFLMVVPLILGKICKDLLSGDISLETQNISSMAIGFVAAFVTGALACKWMVNLVKKKGLFYFSIYCGIVGLAAVVYAYMK